MEIIATVPISDVCPFVCFFFSKSNLSDSHFIITKTRLFKYIENFFHLQKLKIFQIKNSDFLHISAQNVEAVLTSTNNLLFLSRNKKK